MLVSMLVAKIQESRCSFKLRESTFAHKTTDFNYNSVTQVRTHACMHTHTQDNSTSNVENYVTHTLTSTETHNEDLYSVHLPQKVRA